MKRHDLSRLAWDEWRTAVPSLMPNEFGLYEAQPSPEDFEIRPPSWFTRHEIGFAIESGPSLEWTCSALERMNRSALAQLGTAAPSKVTYPKDFARDPRARRRTVKARRPRAESFDETLAEVRARWGG